MRIYRGKFGPASPPPCTSTRTPERHRQAKAGIHRARARAAPTGHNRCHPHPIGSRHMTHNELHETAKALVAPGKGILAADESDTTIQKRFDKIHLESTEELRQAYREILFTTPGVEQFISGVILFDETIRQSASDGTPFPELLASRGIIPGAKVDHGAVPARADRARDGHRGARWAARSTEQLPEARRKVRQVARRPTRSPTSCRATTASGPTRTRSRGTQRCAKRRGLSRLSSPRCSRTAPTRSSGAIT